MGLDDLKPFDPKEKVIEYLLEAEDQKKRLIDMTCKGFAEETASESPAPGGGSIAAYMGALGAALGTMVANLSSHKAGWDDRWEEFSGWAEKGQALLRELLHLVDEDTAAFNRIMDVFAMPKSTDEEKAARSAALQAATLYATQGPLRTMKTAVEVFAIVRAMASEGNPNSVSDAGVGALAARSAVLGACLNVKINAAGLKDRAKADALVAEANALAAEARRESDLNLYRRELEWMRRQPQARATKARARIDSFHELDARLKSTRTQASLKLDVQATRIGTKIFEAKELCKRFGDLVILDRFNYNFARYDKLGIVGDNGCGKSTFLKLLTGIIQPDSGTIEVGESVRFGYYSQQGLDFDEGKRVIDIVTDIAHEIHLGDGRRMSASQFLQYFLFPPEVQYSYVARLSGGERKRLYLCTILIQSPNFLILDEPTNDLDIVTLGVLEEYLQAFKGCVIVVSHDRYFVDKVADHLLVFCGGGEIREFAGTYSDYTAWKRDYEAAKQAAVAQEKAKSTASGSRGGEIRKSGTAPAKTGAARKLTFQEKREMEHLEAEIPELEQEKAAIEEKLSSGDLPFEELTALSERITALMDQIDTKSMRWLELSEIGG